MRKKGETAVGASRDQDHREKGLRRGPAPRRPSGPAGPGRRSSEVAGLDRAETGVRRLCTARFNFKRNLEAAKGKRKGRSTSSSFPFRRRAARGAHARPRRACPHCVARLRISARISPSVAAGSSAFRITSLRQPARHARTARTKPRCRRARAPRLARPIAARRRAPAWRQRESPWAAQMARRVSAAACSCRRRRAARLHWASTVSSSRLREKSAAPAWCRNASESATLAEAIVPVPRPLIGALRGTETALECGAPPRASGASPRRHGCGELRRAQDGAARNAVHMLAAPLGVARHDGGVGLKPHPAA